MNGKAYGRTIEMWKKVVQLAQEGSRVLVCVHQRKMHLYLRDIPLDDEGKKIKHLAKQTGARGWRFDSGGQIYIHVPKQLLTGHTFDVIAVDYEARYHFTIGEWWDSILVRLEPGGMILQ